MHTQYKRKLSPFKAIRILYKKYYRILIHSFTDYISYNLLLANLIELLFKNMLLMLHNEQCVNIV